MIDIAHFSRRQVTPRAKLLAPRTPLMFIESVTWDSAMQPFDGCKIRLRPDMTTVKVEVEVVGAPVPVSLGYEESARVAA